MAGDCNSLAETHAWFDSRVAHHYYQIINFMIKRAMIFQEASILDTKLAVFETMVAKKVQYLKIDQARYFYQVRVTVDLHEILGA